MISAQLSTEFTNHSADQVKYGNLKKVYSIWICLETSDNKSNTIERYRLHREIFPAEKKNQPIPRFDLLEVVIVNISDTYDTQSTESVAIRLLTDLLNEEIDVRKKIDLLQEEYKIKTTVEFEKEVDDMTIFAANYIKRGLEQGLEQGREQGIEQGIEQGSEVVQVIGKKIVLYKADKDNPKIILPKA